MTELEPDAATECIAVMRQDLESLSCAAIAVRTTRRPGRRCSKCRCGASMYHALGDELDERGDRARRRPVCRGPRGELAGRFEEHGTLDDVPRERT